jgi:hypothetical protein
MNVPTYADTLFITDAAIKKALYFMLPPWQWA